VKKLGKKGDSIENFNFTEHEGKTIKLFEGGSREINITIQSLYSKNDKVMVKFLNSKDENDKVRIQYLTEVVGT